MGEGSDRHETTAAYAPEATSQERRDWIRAWAEGWKADLDNRPADHYYANLPLDAACDMILELLEAKS